MLQAAIFPVGVGHFGSLVDRNQPQLTGHPEQGNVAQVAGEAGVLAAEQRSLDEQSRQLNQRSDRLRTDRQALGVYDASRLEALQAQLEAATEAQAEAAARLEDWQAQTPELDDQRRQRQQAMNAEAATLAQLSARLEALRTLQDKLQTSGKLRPWLTRQGLDGLAPLWKRLHIEPGWETPWRPPCASAWVPWKWGGWTRCVPWPPMHRPPGWVFTACRLANLRPRLLFRLA